MPAPRVAMDNLDEFGLEAVCQGIGDRKSMTAIAADANVSIGRLLVWIEADSTRSARVREARAVMARYWDEKAEQVFESATDDLSFKKAKELAHHYRWRASKINAKEYGDKSTVDANLNVAHTELTVEQMDARLAELAPLAGFAKVPT